METERIQTSFPRETVYDTFQNVLQEITPMCSTNPVTQTSQMKVTGT